MGTEDDEDRIRNAENLMQSFVAKAKKVEYAEPGQIYGCLQKLDDGKEAIHRVEVHKHREKDDFVLVRWVGAGLQEGKPWSFQWVDPNSIREIDLNAKKMQSEPGLRAKVKNLERTYWARGQKEKFILWLRHIGIYKLFIPMMFEMQSEEQYPDVPTRFLKKTLEMEEDPAFAGSYDNIAKCRRSEWEYDHKIKLLRIEIEKLGHTPNIYESPEKKAKRLAAAAEKERAQRNAKADELRATCGPDNPPPDEFLDEKAQKMLKMYNSNKLKCGKIETRLADMDSKIAKMQQKIDDNPGKDNFINARDKFQQKRDKLGSMLEGPKTKLGPLRDRIAKMIEECLASQ